MRIAVADLGTNSTRLLIADVDGDGHLSELHRQMTVTRLGEGVEATGRLADEAMERVYAALTRYRDAADASGAELKVAVATSAVRDAENGLELVEHVRDRIGFDVRKISGEEEARLTFLGATTIHEAEETAEMLVIDIGGGSTELVTGHPGRAPSFQVSTRLGSVRHTERHLPSDPPRTSELEALTAEASEIVRAGVPEEVRRSVTRGIAVAGVPTSLVAIDQQLDPYDPAKVDGYRLDLATVERILALLASEPVAQRRQITGLHPDRAPTIVAGVAILAEAMRIFGLDEIEVSEADILDGVALEASSDTRTGA